MQLRLPHARRPTIMMFGSALAGAFLVGAAPQVQSRLDRPNCPETVMHAVASEHPVNGTVGCFAPDYQIRLKAAGIESDGDFAHLVGQNGDYHYLHRTADGGYVYEYDRPMTPHDRAQGALSMLGLYRVRADIRRGDLGAAWREPNDLGKAWAEITGQTQNEKSAVFTLYLDGMGKIERVA